ncbi:MAG: hypothetical protein AAFN93_05235 [Bacteroidota bacterium]
MQIINNSMRKVWLTVTLVLLTYSFSMSQQDSVVVTTDTVDNGEFRKGKRYRYIDHSLFPRKTLFKYGVEVGSFTPDRLSVEHKITPSVSFELGWFVPRDERTGVFTQLRYYVSKRKNAPDSERKVDNFSGNYFSISADRSVAIRTNNNKAFFSNIDYNSNTYSVSFGRQHKVGKWGFFDLSANLEYINYSRILEDRFQFVLKLRGGAAYGRTKGSNYLLEDKFSDFKTEYRREKYLFKLSNPSLGISRNQIGGGFTFGVERRLLNEFSLISNISIGASSFENIQISQPSEELKFNLYSANLGLELRYYYGHNKRLRKGSDFRPFSGTYIGIGLNSLYTVRRFDFMSGEEPTMSQFWGDINGTDFLEYKLNWGMQKRVGKRIFLDMSFGITYDTFYDNLYLYNVNSSVGITLGK